ncbi:hypothetical protein SBOR_6395 [Sclerotinia borealis F-4128]|uniref:Calcineurin-like phosphoesterase domain-containing protein n=1 Tax=Sclerotinia borealis (strain F-4128) TaxID=1432307 RepID=W9CEL4_SCLBF|nr:hypothetical protein SBOR_6395 [Sclerotinia borealis F-4128]
MDPPRRKSTAQVEESKSHRSNQSKDGDKLAEKRKVDGLPPFKPDVRPRVESLRRTAVEPSPRKEVKPAKQVVESGRDTINNRERSSTSKTPAGAVQRSTNSRHSTITQNNSPPPAPSRDPRDPPERRGRDTDTPKSNELPTHKRGVTLPKSSSSRRNLSQDPKSSKISPSLSSGMKSLRLDKTSTQSKAPTPVNYVKESDRASEPKSEPDDELIIARLPTKYLPKKHAKHESCLIVLGDVHGMPDAKDCLLKEVKYNPDYDHQIFAGDMVTKGRKSRPSKPDMTPAEVTIEASKDVLCGAMRHEASAIRGNHEDILLNVEHARKGWIEDTERLLDGGFRVKKLLRTPTASDKALYDALSTDERKWLKKLPHILVLGKVGGRNNMLVVHAGLNAKRRLEHQHVIETMNLKSIDIREGNTSSMARGDKERKNLALSVDQDHFKKMEPWFDAWDKKQNTLQPDEQTTAIYGHESKLGLMKKNFSIGLDTGVQRIDKDDPNKYRTLTALIIYHDRCKIVQVKEVKNSTVGLHLVEKRGQV